MGFDLLLETKGLGVGGGNFKFEREKILEKGIGNLLKKTVTGEGAKLTKAVGQGKVYLADSGKTVHILRLQDESIFVNGNDLLAFEPSIDWDIKIMRKVSAMLSPVTVRQSP